MRLMWPCFGYSIFLELLLKVRLSICVCEVTRVKIVNARIRHVVFLRQYFWTRDYRNLAVLLTISRYFELIECSNMYNRSPPIGTHTRLTFFAAHPAVDKFVAPLFQWIQILVELWSDTFFFQGQQLSEVANVEGQLPSGSSETSLIL